MAPRKARQLCALCNNSEPGEARAAFTLTNCNFMKTCKSFNFGFETELLLNKISRSFTSGNNKQATLSSSMLE